MQDLSTEQLASIRAWLGAGSINIFGKQFAGKDTQCRRLAELFDGVVIGGGDILRSDTTPQHILDIIASGELSPTHEYRAIVTPYFARPEFRNKPLLLSSVGRMHGEEQPILEAAQQSGHAMRAVIALDVSDSEVWRRYDLAKSGSSRGARADDDVAGLTRRLARYHDHTLPVLATYDELGLLIHVNGEQSASNVTREILEKLYQKCVHLK